MIAQLSKVMLFKAINPGEGARGGAVG
jgi:hypothetical protein